MPAQLKVACYRARLEAAAASSVRCYDVGRPDEAAKESAEKAQSLLGNDVAVTCRHRICAYSSV